MSPTYDIVCVGGGLACGLIADRIRARHPGLSLLVIEEGATLGGNHTWSFHATDLTDAQHNWIAPYVAHRWPRQEVRFPTYKRVLETGYCSVPSSRFHEVLSTALGGSAIRLSTRVVDVAAASVTLDDQTRISARCVIDGRGPRSDPALALGYQKFLGREVETVEPHGLDHPIIMDATVAQTDGYRFVYTLPLDPRRLLIEDTFYADRADLDLDQLGVGIESYATSQGWHIAREIRREHGVLPIVLAGDMDRFWRDIDVARVGLRAALFHPTTGYSLPDAVRLAEHIAALDTFTTARVAGAVRDIAVAQWRARGFFRLLNRMLFLAATGAERQRVLARFYRLRQPLIERFYAGAPTTGDQMRILAGRPPVALSRALPCLSTRPAWTFARSNTGGVA